jgi:hypothetical protein
MLEVSKLPKKYINLFTKNGVDITKITYRKNKVKYYTENIEMGEYIVSITRESENMVCIFTYRRVTEYLEKGVNITTKLTHQPVRHPFPSKNYLTEILIQLKQTL